jgi:hypothetical protein
MTTLTHTAAGTLPDWLIIAILIIAAGLTLFALASTVGRWLKGRTGVTVDEGQAFGEGDYR